MSTPLRLLPVALFAIACGTSCSPPSVEGAALRIQLSLEQGVTSKHACVGVAAGEHVEWTEPVSLEGGEALVAIFAGGALKGEVEVFAHGFDSASCEGAPSSKTSRIRVAFPERGTHPVELALEAYQCSCADPLCEGTACDDGNACTTETVCQAGACGGGSAVTCEETRECYAATCDPEKGCVSTVRLGQSCTEVAGGTCFEDGVCRVAEVDCGNGVDDDGDGPSDCEDSDCVGLTCRAASDLCDVAEVCLSGLNTCPANTFAADTVECRPASGDCDAAELCTGTSASCPQDGYLASTEVCRASAGDCDAAELCPGDGSSCPADALAMAGTPCSTGSCDSAGVCVAVTTFPYAPSNFTTAAVSGSTTSARTINCTVAWDSTPGAVNPDWCMTTQPAPAGVEVSLSNGDKAVVIALFGLNVNSGAELRFTGSRPVILAVFGSATVDGTIVANGNLAQGGAGAAAALASCGSRAGGVGGTSTPDIVDPKGGGGGGGGGGYGTAGGEGGRGSNKDGTGGAKGTVGTSGGSPTLVPLLAGCPGGNGGKGGGSSQNGAGGAGGRAGGALQISVSGTLNVNATARIGANGEGGRGATSYHGGGGGGGSGGAILLEADVLNVASGAIVSATGGGGGEGAYETKIGEDGDPGSFTAGGAGGDDTTQNDKAGKGGDGVASGTGKNGSDGNNSNFCGGGGAGGGIGRVLVYGHTSCAVDGTVNAALQLGSGC